MNSGYVTLSQRLEKRSYRTMFIATWVNSRLESFGRAFVCRHCGARYCDLNRQNYQGPMAIQKSLEEYNEELRFLTTNKKYVSPFGIRKPSAFASLKINLYQIAPVDPFHDFAEGVASLIGEKTLKLLKNHLNSSQLKNRLKSLKM